MVMAAVSSGSSLHQPGKKIPVVGPSKDSANADNAEVHQNYKGFVAGVFSGVSKLCGKNRPRGSPMLDSSYRAIIPGISRFQLHFTDHC